MTAIEGGESLTVLLRGRTDQGVAKLKGMATAIPPKALTGELARGCVDGLGVQPGKEGNDPFLFTAPHPCAYLCSANGRVSEGFASRCLGGYPTTGSRITPQKIKEHVRVENHPANRSVRFAT
jgi:hypothetical protein